MRSVTQASRVAKVAMFFAKVDGIVATEEKSVILDFKNKLKQAGILATDKDSDDFDCEMYKGLSSIEEVISETRAILSEDSERMRRPILNAMDTLIESIILADGDVSVEESNSYNIWKKEFTV